jgi:hypothetical protein
LNRLFPSVCILVAAAGLLLSNRSVAQNTSPGRRMPAKIIDGPAIESLNGSLAIIRWTSSNPGGTEEHFGVVHYGTNPAHLTQFAKSHIRLNPSHLSTIFRVRVAGLAPGITYYYKVDSTTATGASDRVVSPLKHFTTSRDSSSAE